MTGDVVKRVLSGRVRLARAIAMPPKGKAESAKAKKVEDKTFGMKNKNKSKVVQQYIKQISVEHVSRDDARKRKEKEDRERERIEQAERDAVFKPVITQSKAPVGAPARAFVERARFRNDRRPAPAALRTLRTQAPTQSLSCAPSSRRANAPKDVRPRATRAARALVARARRARGSPHCGRAAPRRASCLLYTSPSPRD